VSSTRGILDTPPLRSPFRFVAAAACLVAAAAHVPVVEDHVHEATYIGVLFIVLSAACCAVALRLVQSDTRRVWAVVTLRRSRQPIDDVGQLVRRELPSRPGAVDGLCDG
jgi:hypothetical protein